MLCFLAIFLGSFAEVMAGYCLLVINNAWENCFSKWLNNTCDGQFY